MEQIKPSVIIVVLFIIIIIIIGKKEFSHPAKVIMIL